MTQVRELSFYIPAKRELYKNNHNQAISWHNKTNLKTTNIAHCISAGIA